MGVPNPKRDDEVDAIAEDDDVVGGTEDVTS
jgi:hypothetical protein